MKFSTRIYICLTLVICAVLSCTFSVSATETISKADRDALLTVLKSTDAGSGNNDKCNKIVLPNGKTFSLFSFKVSSKGSKYYDISFDGVNFSKLSDETKERLLSNFETAVTKSKISAQGQQYIYSEIRDNYDYDIALIQENIVEKVQPNMFTAYELMHPFSGVVGTVIGCICVVIILSLVMTTLLDVMYMQFPVFREKTFQATQKSNNGRFSFIRNRTQIERPWFISYEAAYANKVNVESNGEKNALIVYLRYRIVSLIVITICIAYLTGGLFMDVVRWIWEHFNHIFSPEIWGAGT